MVMLTNSAAMNQSIHNHYTTKPCISHLQKKLYVLQQNNNLPIILDMMSAGNI